MGGVVTDRRHSRGTEWFREQTGLSVRRCEHWRLNDVIKPYGPRRPGSGVTHVWPRSEVNVGRTLRTIADFGLGSNTEMLRVIGEELRLDESLFDCPFIYVLRTGVVLPSFTDDMHICVPSSAWTVSPVGRR